MNHNIFVFKILFFFSCKLFFFLSFFFNGVFVLRTWAFEIIFLQEISLVPTLHDDNWKHPEMFYIKKLPKPNNSNKVTGSQGRDQPRQLKSFWVAEQSFLQLQFQSCWKLSLSWIPLMRNLSGSLVTPLEWVSWKNKCNFLLPLGRRKMEYLFIFFLFLRSMWFCQIPSVTLWMASMWWMATWLGN